MAQQNDDVFNDTEKDTTATGSNQPHGDGTVSDEDMDAISGGRKHQKTGQDHSTEDHEKEAPTSGVGAIQDSSTIRENVAHIVDDEE